MQTRVCRNSYTGYPYSTRVCVNAALQWQYRDKKTLLTGKYKPTVSLQQKPGLLIHDMYKALEQSICRFILERDQ